MRFATSSSSSSSFTARCSASFARYGDTQKSRRKMPPVALQCASRNEEDDDTNDDAPMKHQKAYSTSKRPIPMSSRRHSLVALTTAVGAFALSNAAFGVQSLSSSSQESLSTAIANANAAQMVSSNYDDDGMTYVYFGNGCFWGRQHEFVALEKEALHRSDAEVKSLAGYAGGKRGGGGKNRDTVCYYYGSSDTVYERLGHAEVVRVAYADEEEFKKFCEVYFRNFNKTPFGMQRVDPQDAGPGYRNVVGIPGGIDNEKLMKQMKSANANDMKLVRGEGNEFDARGKPTENDQINVVWIVDSEKLPFYPAEMYHQFHDGLGYKFPESYTVDLKRAAAKSGSIGPVPGCPEMRERAFADFVESAEG